MTFRIYSLNNFQVYNTVSLTAVTMLSIRSPFSFSYCWEFVPVAWSTCIIPRFRRSGLPLSPAPPQVSSLSKICHRLKSLCLLHTPTHACTQAAECGWGKTHKHLNLLHFKFMLAHPEWAHGAAWQSYGIFPENSLTRFSRWLFHTFSSCLNSPTFLFPFSAFFYLTEKIKEIWR